MAKKKDEKDVLIVRDEKTGEISVVAGLQADGTPKRTPAKMENSKDFLQFDKNGDVLDNFFRNFFRQCKEPSRFGFYRIAADQAENLLGVMKELLKDPAANADLLAPHKVDTSAYEKQVAQEQKVQEDKKQEMNQNQTNNVEPQKQENMQQKQENVQQSAQENKQESKQRQGYQPIDYPRTGSRYIPEDVFDEIPKLLAFLGGYPEWIGKVPRKDRLTRRSVDGSKVTDHHALLVTGEKPLFLSKEDNTVYQMIAGRMVEAFSDKCVKELTTVTALSGEAEFAAKGCVIRQTGWRAVLGEDSEEQILPGWKSGETLSVCGVSLTEGKTKPKPLHTEATLLSAMETAGKDVEDEEVRQAMKECGIGTPATRAAIIETLFARGYVQRCKKSLVPTEKGLALYSVVKEMRIADAALTGEWERELARIERGEKEVSAFHGEIERYTTEITAELLSCDKIFGHKPSGCTCPKCGKGQMQFYGKVVRCDNPECGLPVFRQKANRDLKDEEIRELLTTGKTSLLKGFKSKQGKSFDAVIAFDADYNTVFVFPEVKNKGKYSQKRK